MNIKHLLCILFFLPTEAVAQYPLDSLLNQLDEAILKHDIYVAEKEVVLDSLKTDLRFAPESTTEKYSLISKLYEEYRPYNLDSAIFYMNMAIDAAEKLNNESLKVQSQLQLAYLMASTGMYMEAVNLINSVDHNRLPEHLIIDYYNTFRHVYAELAFYTQDNSGAQQYWDISNQYSDSLINLLTPENQFYYEIKEANLRNAGNYDEALKLNDVILQKHKVGTRKFAIAAYNRSLTYRELGNRNGEKYFLALSALSDIKSSTKDHASLWMLAEILYDENDMERAYNYIRFSWSETVAFNARLRSLQSAVILSLIDSTYQATMERKNTQLQWYIIIISGLVVLLAVAFIYIYNQMKRLAAARMKLQVANSSLSHLNDELKKVNQQLQEVNSSLSESNLIKEEYIGHFIKLCSTYINKMDDFRKMVNKKLTAGHVEELTEVIRSRDLMDNEIAELYRNFDKAFLQIFPHFVENVNELFVEEEKIVTKNDELLNVELRILALIRLGINNSSQIADFLRYSVNTIYNYRAKIKNKTRYRDDFEERLLTIR